MSNHQYESVYATQPPMGISSGWKVAAAFSPAAQLVGSVPKVKWTQAIKLTVITCSYMMLAIVIGDTSQELHFNHTATASSAIVIIALPLLALVWITSAKWQQRVFLLHLFT